MSEDELADEAMAPALEAEAVPRRLRAARQLARLTTTQMGELIGCSARTVTAHEREKETLRCPRARVAVYVMYTEGTFDYFYGLGPDLPGQA